MGNPDTSLLDHITKGVSDCFKYPVIRRSLIESMEFAFDSERNQYHSTPVLERFSSLAPSNAIKILAVCDRDLFIPILTHVYGEAQLNGTSCIISTYRLEEKLPMINSRAVFFQRALKEAVHELGHTFNIRHCPDKSCIMHYCRSIDDVDNKFLRFCRYCGILLADAKRKTGSII